MSPATRVKRERPKVMRLTDAAAARVHEIMKQSDGQYIGVRVGVTNGGCAGQAYTMDYADAQLPLDEVVEDKGVRIFVDPKAVMFLIGTEMDYAHEKLAARFIFHNPNQTEACGCGESVTLKPANSEVE
jgi:iron-sulfur cluster assembly protein